MPLDPDVPQHLALPLRLDKHGDTVCYEQDSDGEIQTNVLVAVSYPQRYLRYDPDFGAQPPPFRQNGTDLEQLHDRILAVEDRADTAAIDRVISGVRERITIDPTARS